MRSSWLWGRFSGFGVALAALVFAIDQAHKYWMIHVFRIAERGRVEVTPFFDLVMVWNPGVSYGLFPQDSPGGRFMLIAIALTASAGLFLWLARLSSVWTAAAVGLIIGGAIGNTVDRIVYGAVADFFSFHVSGLYWYVFNIADVAIVAGVIVLLGEVLLAGHKNVAKSS